MQQLWTSLGPDGSKYVIWLAVGIALLIGLMLVMWGLMRLFGQTLNMGASGRGQPQRLGITGAFNLDRKGRKLVIVRRDNVEHLVLIGGPNDVLVESNIIRAERNIRPGAPGRESDSAALPVTPVAAPVAASPAPTAPVVLPPVAPPAAPVPAPAPAPALAPVAPVPAPVPAPRVHVAPPQPAPVPVAAPAPPLRPAMAPAAPKPPVIAERAPAPPTAPMVAPTPPPAPVVPVRAPSQPPPEKPPEPPREAPRVTADPRLSDMARRLQSVLKSPLTPVVARAPDPVAAAKADNIPIPLPSARPPETRPHEPAPVAAAPAAPMPQGKSVSSAPRPVDSPAIDSLEEEMARLLGRTGPGKS